MKKSLINDLGTLYRTFVQNENLPELSADEQDEETMTELQKRFNKLFSEIWDVCAEIESNEN